MNMIWYMIRRSYANILFDIMLVTRFILQMPHLMAPLDPGIFNIAMGYISMFS